MNLHFWPAFKFGLRARRASADKIEGYSSDFRGGLLFFILKLESKRKVAKVSMHPNDIIGNMFCFFGCFGKIGLSTINVTKLVESSFACASIYTCFRCQIQACIRNSDIFRRIPTYSISSPRFHVSMCT